MKNVFREERYLEDFKLKFIFVDFNCDATNTKIKGEKCKGRSKKRKSICNDNALSL